MNHAKFLAKCCSLIAAAVLVGFGLLVRPETAYASSTRFVATTGTDGFNPCLAHSFPCKTIAHALQQAAAGDTISIASGEYHEHLTIGKDITLRGAGQNTTILKGHTGFGEPFYRMIWVKKHSHVTISHLAITRGILDSDDGAGIKNEGTLTLKDILLESNTIYTSGEGGGIFNAFGATLNIQDSLLRQNFAVEEGGGIYSAGHLKMTNTWLQFNSTLGTTGFGGGLADVGGGTAVLTDDTFENNEADKGGGIFVYSGALTLNQVALAINFATQMGGGLYNELGETRLTEVEFTNNTASNNNGVGQGGGIANVNSSITLNSVTFDRNAAQNVGGGLYTVSDFGSVSSLYDSTVLTNVTFHANSANLGIGNDIYNGNSVVGPSKTILKNVTIFENNNNQTGQAIYNSAGTLSLKNSIVSTFPGSGACYTGGAATTTSLGHNLGDTSCGLDATKHDRIGVDPKLGNFGNHGAFTKTIQLKSASPAIDHGTNKGCPSDDQRGITRPVDGDGNGTATCDIGAYEFKP